MGTNYGCTYILLLGLAGGIVGGGIGICVKAFGGPLWLALCVAVVVGGVVGGLISYLASNKKKGI